MTAQSYDVAWAPSAQRDLSRQPEKIAAAVIEFAYATLASNPRRIGRELHLDLAGHFSARRGEYRIIYRVDDETHLINVMAVDHRADVYRRRSR